MFEQKDALCDIWIKEPIEIRQHSRLYNLKPIGVGSPMVESLTSYVTRLADAHSTSVNTLVSHEITPHLRQSYLSRSLDHKGHAAYQVLTAFWRESMTINGLTNWAEDWVQGLEQLTMRHDLRFLTMLSWKEVLSPIELMRRTQSWCPVCYEEWQEENLTIYQPLLWALQCIYICPRHNLALQQQCPYADCGRRLSFLNSKTQAGYCTWCNRWLGCSIQCYKMKQVNLEDKEASWHQQVVHAVEEMLSFAPSLQKLPNREMISSMIILCINEITNGNEAELARLLEVSRKAIVYWKQGKNFTKFEGFLRMCSHLGISPLNLLTAKMVEITGYQRQVIERFSKKAKPRRAKRDFDDKSIQGALEAILQSSEDPFPSLNQVTKRLGHTYWLLFKHFPDLCQAISARYLDEQKKKWGKKLQNALEAVLHSSESPHPSMHQVAKELGYSYSLLFKHFPELCRAISALYLDDIKRQRVERTQKLCEEVRQATLSVHAQGIYPSNSKVRTLLKPEISMQDPEVRATWKATLQELGWT